MVAAAEHPAAGPMVLPLDDDLRVVGQTPTSGALPGALLPSSDPSHLALVQAADWIARVSGEQASGGRRGDAPETRV